MTRHTFGGPLIAGLVLTTACVSGYRQFYRNTIGGRSVEEVKELEPHAGYPEFYQGTEPQQDMVAMSENNYVLIGYSAFEGKLEDVENARWVGRDLRAAVVLIYSKYNRTVSGTIPFTVSNPSQTVTTYSSGSVYGSGGVASYSGTSTSTVPGGYTTYDIPYSVDRYNQTATFWVKTKKRPILGALIRDLNEDERRTIESNKGVSVIAVRKQSPAHECDMLRGDIILSMDGERVIDQKQGLEAVRRLAGREVAIELARGGARRVVRCKLNEVDDRF